MAANLLTMINIRNSGKSYSFLIIFNLFKHIISLSYLKFSILLSQTFYVVGLRTIIGTIKNLTTVVGIRYAIVPSQNLLE